MTTPDDRRYTDQHEWALLAEGGLRIGITDYAQDALGDVVFVDLPATGGHVEVGATIAEVESTKSLAEVYAPCSGTIVEVNTALVDTPERINSDPYGEGWFLVLEPDDPAAYTGLLDAIAYRALIA
ncbi:MAG: glycine cleavage system protein H [Actinobacteria bacterium RBG_16_67_10]|nr:MAG: glycine cleavage system protein H [Actinobacteria bacterium RBG_16_67_10]